MRVVSSRRAHAPGPDIPRAMIVGALGSIDNDVPYVIDVSSPNSSISYPFGVGDYRHPRKNVTQCGSGR